MNTVVTYEAVRMLLANPPSINPRPNFFNICELQSHFARALKKIPCPQSPVNGWPGAVMSPEMYALVDQNVFHLNITPTTTTPSYPIKFNLHSPKPILDIPFCQKYFGVLLCCHESVNDPAEAFPELVDRSPQCRFHCCVIHRIPETTILKPQSE